MTAYDREIDFASTPWIWRNFHAETKASLNKTHDDEFSATIAQKVESMSTPHKLDKIVEGMEIYDKDGILVGTVDAFRIGRGAIKTRHTALETIVEAITEVLGEA